MKSMMIVKFLPLPADSGGNQRSLAVLRKLLEQGECVLCGFDDGRADVDGLRALGADVRAVPLAPSRRRVASGVARTRSGSAARFWHPELAAAVTEVTRAEPVDVLVVEHSQMAPYMGLPRALTRVLDMHNVESALAASYAASAGRVRGLAARLEAVALRRLERRAAKEADVVMVVSHKDRERLVELGRERDVLLCPNGWDLGEPLPPATDPVAVFVGLLGWRPNEDAAVWLGKEIWPRVRRHLPDANLLLVGRDPTPSVLALQGPGCEVTGSVPSVRPYLGRARVALAPLRAGGGTRLKVLEALDAGRPVVATSIGAEGLEELVGRGLVIADEPQEIADAVCDFLLDEQLSVDQGSKGRQAVRERYGWDEVLKPLERRFASADRI